jgi:hypothetical protein
MQPMVSDLLGNKTEEAIRQFLNDLDNNKSFGPKPVEGKSYNNNDISNVLDCNDKLAMKLFTEPTPFMYDELDQVYIEVDSDDTDGMQRMYLTSDKFDPLFDKTCEEIGRKLPEVPYDVECGGYSSRQTEAAALYKICIINSLQDGQYNSEIRNILDGYDFTRWISKDSSYKFTSLLQKIQEEADTLSRVILMCANIKLIAERVKKDTSYKAILKEEDAEKLRLLSEEDARINFLFNKRYESATSSKEKIEIGEELANARKKMLEADFVTDDISVLFTIYNLNQNSIPGRAKRIIRNAASTYVAKLSNDGIIKNKESASEFQKKLISRAQKLYLSRLKQIRYKLWNDRTPDTDLSSLIPKF